MRVDDGFKKLQRAVELRWHYGYWFIAPIGLEEFIHSIHSAQVKMHTTIRCALCSIECGTLRYEVCRDVDVCAVEVRLLVHVNTDKNKNRAGKLARGAA